MGLFLDRRAKRQVKRRPGFVLQQRPRQFAGQAIGVRRAQEFIEHREQLGVSVSVQQVVGVVGEWNGVVCAKVNAADRAYGHGAMQAVPEMLRIGVVNRHAGGLGRGGRGDLGSHPENRERRGRGHEGQAEWHDLSPGFGTSFPL